MGGESKEGPSEVAGAEPRKEPGPPRRTALMVTGMHRSGTSAVARLLMLLGGAAPRNLMPPREGNETGHWEPEPIVDMHDEIFGSIGSSWDDVSPFPQSWFTSEAGMHYRARAVELVEQEFGDAALLVIKDPRISRLVPLWLGALRSLKVDPAFVIPVRNPLEVAASLKSRDSIPPPRSLLLWLRDMLEVERGTRSEARAFVSYERLLRDWQEIAREVSERLDVTWSRWTHRSRLEVDEFLSEGLRHHAFSYDEVQLKPEVFDWVRRAHAELNLAAETMSEPDRGILDLITAQLDRADEAFGPVVAELQAKAESNALAGRDVEQVESETVRELREKLASTESSRAEQARLAERSAAQLAARTEQLEQGEQDRQRLRGDLATLTDRLTEQEAARLEGERALDLERAERASLEAASQRQRESELKMSEELHSLREEVATLTDLVDAVREAAASRGFRAALGRSFRRLNDARRSAFQMASWMLRHPSRRGFRNASTYVALRRSRVFDADFYLSQSPDVAAAGQNPLMHYIEHGATEGRDPNPYFKTAEHLDRHPELIESGLNPLLHQIKYVGPLQLPPGHAGSEGRSAWLQSRGGDAHARAQRRVAEERAELVATVLPKDATVLITGPSDEEALGAHGVTTWPFPRLPEAGTGQPPSGQTSAMAQLEALRAEGAGYLLVPSENGEWLTAEKRFGRYLDRNYPVVASADSGFLFDLSPRGSGDGPWPGQFADLTQEHQLRAGSPPDVLDWDSGLELASKFFELTVIEPPATVGGRLPYLSKSIDLVVIGEGNQDGRDEARRVARNGIVSVREANGSFDLSVEWFEPAPQAPPGVSIVIPTYDRAALLNNCLASLLETLPSSLESEVIVVDDASTDDTAAVLSRFGALDDRFRSILNPKNLGFVDSCNRGAAEANGDVLVFLNNDTISVHGWLEPLSHTLLGGEDVGAVGGMLIYPDGRLQEAGAVLFSDGTGANLGNTDSQPDRPIYRFVREVDYCSGAMLATRREVFEGLAGFDTLFRPCYYEETDYCFRAREAGLRTLYQPESVVVHFEGATGGTDDSPGEAKKYQEGNRLKFASRWAEVLRSQPPRPTEIDETTLNNLARHRPSVGTRSAG